jgi:cellulose synthase/poly-beta-1,6-N-acetylglucosamine synthase-like glycosyltransferase
MKQIEIPLKNQRTWRYRVFEILPGALSWGTLALPFALSFFNPTLAAYFIILFMLSWLFKASGYAIRVSMGYSRLTKYMRMDWLKLLEDFKHPKSALSKALQDDSVGDKWHKKNLAHYASLENKIHPSDIYHVVILPTYNEAPEVVEPTIQSLVGANYDVKHKVIFILAYEQRGGLVKKQQSIDQIERFRQYFFYAEAVEHPSNMPDEVIGKGGNATYAGRRVVNILKELKITDMDNIIVTTIDSDNRPHPHYFAALTYTYILDENRQYKSFQPIPMFLNNIWDAPAPMRVLATGNSFWNLISSIKPHLMRNFSAHAQGMRALIDTDFWSVRTIVEDGHQFWRTYFRYDGRHDVVPIYIPMYQDAVLEETYRKTLKAQFIQLRRWAWGASDVAYVIRQGFQVENKVPRRDLFFKIFRLLESHVSWATAPLLLAGAAWLPILLNPDAQDNIVAHQLPRIASGINTLIVSGILVTVFLSLKVLPPRPPRYKASRNILMIFQWVLLPPSSIVYGSFAALYSQTRLMLGRYLDKFDVTTKAVKS